VPTGSTAVREGEPYGRIEPIDGRACRLEIGADTPESPAFLRPV